MIFDPMNRDMILHVLNAAVDEIAIKAEHNCTLTGPDGRMATLVNVRVPFVPPIGNGVPYLLGPEWRPATKEDIKTKSFHYETVYVYVLGHKFKIENYDHIRADIPECWQVSIDMAHPESFAQLKSELLRVAQEKYDFRWIPHMHTTKIRCQM